MDLFLHCILDYPATGFTGFRNVSHVMIIGKMLKPGFLSVIQELFRLGIKQRFNDNGL